MEHPRKALQGLNHSLERTELHRYPKQNHYSHCASNRLHFACAPGSKGGLGELGSISKSSPSIAPVFGLNAVFAMLWGGSALLLLRSAQGNVAVKLSFIHRLGTQSCPLFLA